MVAGGYTPLSGGTARDLMAIWERSPAYPARDLGQTSAFSYRAPEATRRRRRIMKSVVRGRDGIASREELRGSPSEKSPTTAGFRPRSCRPGKGPVSGPGHPEGT